MYQRICTLPNKTIKYRFVRGDDTKLVRIARKLSKLEPKVQLRNFPSVEQIQDGSFEIFPSKLKKFENSLKLPRVLFSISLIIYIRQIKLNNFRLDFFKIEFVEFECPTCLILTVHYSLFGQLEQEFWKVMW